MRALVAEADVSGPSSSALPASVPVRLRDHLVLPQLHRPVVWKLQAPLRRRMRKGSFTVAERERESEKLFSSLLPLNFNSTLNFVVSHVKIC